MWRKSLLSVLLAPLLVCSSFAQYYSINLDTQEPSSQPVIDRMFSGNNTYLRAFIFESGAPVNLSGWAMTFRYSYGQYSTQGMVTVSGTTSSNRVDFLGATNLYARPYENYYWSISGTYGGGYTKTFGTGTLKVYYDPATSTNLYALMDQVNISWLTNFIGAQVESNRIRIAVFETSKVDTVTFNASNSAIIGVISAETSRATNAETIISNTFSAAFVDQNSTNTGFQAQHTAQSASNILFQASITANSSFTNEAHTAYGWGNHATNGYITNSSETLWPAVSNSVIVNANNGATAYGWGNHASAGYLTATTNTFSELYVANKSSLDTNISGLTQGTYTGSLTSVSYTGVTEMVIGNTYVIGFTKIGSYGTATLSIASCSLSATTAGATSNYFAYTTADTNLVLKLDGNGLSICNVSNVYVRRITNGNAHIAGSIDIGGNIRIFGAERTNWPSGVWGGIIGILADQTDLQAALDSKAGTNDMIQAQGDISDLTVDLANHKTNVDVHAIAAVSGLQSSLDGKASTGTVAAISADLANHKTNASVHAIAAVDGLQSALDGKASTNDMIQAQGDISDLTADLANHKTNVDVHAIAAVDGLQAAIDSKSGTGTVAAISLDFGAHTNNEAADIQHLTATQVGALTNELPVRIGAVEAKTSKWDTASVNASASTNSIAMHVSDTDNPHAVTAVQVGAVPTNDPKYLAALTNETYLGTITGATIAAGSSDSVVITGPNAAFTWNTNAAGGGGVGTITNILSSDSSVAVAESGGPQPDLSVTSYVAGVVADYVPTSDPTYQAIETNRIALQDGSNISWRVDGTNVYPDLDPAIPADIIALKASTNALNAAYPIIEGGANIHTTQTPTGQVLTVDAGAVDYGVTDSTAYRGDWGNAVSGQVVNLHTATGSLNTAVGNLASATNALNTRADNLESATNNLNTVANAALPKSSTNDLAVTALQVTGGSPTNGAVWIATNTAGQGKWSLPVAFQGTRNASTNFFNGTLLVVPWNVEKYDKNNNFDGTSFVAPVNGLYSFSFVATTYPQKAPTLGDWVYQYINVNGVAKSINMNSSYTAAGYQIRHPAACLTAELTNGAVVTVSVNGVAGNTNTLWWGESDSVASFFEGYLIRELP